MQGLATEDLRNLHLPCREVCHGFNASTSLHILASYFLSASMLISSWVSEYFQFTEAMQSQQYQQQGCMGHEGSGAAGYPLCIDDTEAGKANRFLLRLQTGNVQI